jgi:hypothetical protein
MRPILTLLITLITGNLYAQYRFIEPNISFRYDNNLLTVKDSSANAIAGTEAYGFTVAIPGRIRTYAQISTDNAIVKPGQAAEDSLYKALIKQVTRYAGDSIIVQHKKFISYKEFTGLGYIARHKKQNAWSVAFYGARFLEEGICKLYYTSLSKQAIDSMGDDYVKFTSLLDGIQTYTKKDIQTAYTVIVDTLSLPGSMPGATYTGIVRLKEKTSYAVHSVKMDYQSYFPDYRGQVIIFCQDADKGRIEKKGELIVLNEIGKKISIPFSFAYYNNK